VNLRPAKATEPTVRAMLEAQDAEYAPLYPPEVNFTVPIEELDRPDLKFFALQEGGADIGCGGILLTSEFAELKRIYITPTARGGGRASQIVKALEAVARDAGQYVVRLETGEESPAAIRLYEKLGYRRIPAFGDYEENGSSVFMEKTL